MSNELTLAEKANLAKNTVTEKITEAVAPIAAAVHDESKFSADAAPVAKTVSEGEEINNKVNVLHNYVNFTYLVTLHMMSKTELEELSKKKSPVTPTVIISSAGLSASAKTRRKGWNENFFIEDLSVDTIIGLNAHARGSNAVKVTFKILEPNGVSLLERLLTTSMELEYVDLKDIIYVIQIDFTGYNSDGKPTAINNHTKFIPITITGMEFKISERGSEYDISAVPYNHLGLAQLRLTVPTNIAITASTVSEYFTDASIIATSASNDETRDAAPAAQGSAATSSSYMSAINKFERKKVEEGKQEVADIYNVIFHKEIKDSKLSTDTSKEAITSTPMHDASAAEAAPVTETPPPTTSSAVNLDMWFTFGNNTGSKESFLKLDGKLQKCMIDFAKQWYSTQRTKINITSAFRTSADQERIRKDSISGRSKYPAAQPGKSLHEMGLAVDIDSYQANLAEKLGLLADNGLYRPFKNDPVHLIMIGSGKVTSANAKLVSDVSTAAAKIAPVKKGQIKYGVLTTEINSGTILIDEINKIVRNSEFFHKQLPDSTENKKPAVPLVWWKIIPTLELLDYDKKRNTYGKKITYYVNPYNIYSSALPNTPSVTPPIQREYQYLFTGKNLDIREFNLSFNTQFYLALSVNINNLKATAQSADAATENQQESGTEEISEIVGPGVAFTSVTINPVPNNVAATAGSELKRDGKSILAGDIQEMLLNQRGGDMISVSMSILGDPAFIKQDDICVGPETDSASLNGSFPTDVGEVYLKIEFKTPVDVGENTGLMSLGGNSTKTSKFSGLYRLLSVTSTFARGEFIQKLEVIRIFTDDIFNQTPTASTAKTRE